MALKYTYKPLYGSFPRALRSDDERKPTPFSKTWEEILMLLERELWNLNYRDGSCVIQTAHTAAAVRGDGQLRRDARQPEHPGVVVRFDVYDYTKKRYVPMSFECDRFLVYEANLRAIVDAMEALRKIDRYAVTGGGRDAAQYEGYKALPSAEGKTTSVEDAAAFLAIHSGANRHDILINPSIRAEAYKKAAAKLHPDTVNGSHELFLELQKAVKLLGVNSPVSSSA